ncbi:uncharacterized protein LOC110038029 [Phalaenopsis equestris]|uniref:uncharacterized protein LOC110020421 n=1 Tax=Phalaenopsis equestris TaxID=78828 RepID=UPI0009E4A988|nr:uncharacterized protein LOC110020421 [Phalaenopsis equestris]XP_020598445.1 uncharacterized protein LOC110038029 [Phalaenopsis equestris]
MAVISSISHSYLFLGSMDSNKLRHNHRSMYVSLQGRFFRNPRSSELVVLMSGSGTNGSGDIKEEGVAGDAPGELKRDRLPAFNLRWWDLLNPDPENILSVGLTGLLIWASVQVLWQLFIVSFAIVLAALKYSFIAAVLLLILLTLL